MAPRATSLLATLLAFLLAPVSAQEAGGGQARGRPTQDPPDRRDRPDRPDRPEGPIVREIVVEGLQSYDEQGVLRALGIELGKPFPLQRSGVQRVWDVYRVIVHEPVIEPLGDGVKVTIRVKELPLDVDPRFVGNVEISTEKLREWAQLYDREQIYLHEAERIKRRLITGYRHQGFHHAEIDIVTGGVRADEGIIDDVIFEIREGPKVRVTGVRVRGNESMRDTGWGFWRGGLRKMAEVQTKGRGLFRWWGGVFDEEELLADLVAMRQVYRDRGWLDVKVELGPLKFNDARNRVKVHILVDEGPLWRVGALDIVGVEVDEDGRERQVPLVFPREELLQYLQLKPGVPFEALRVLVDQRTLTSYYGERGYPQRRDFWNPLEAEGFMFLDPPLLIFDFERKEVAVTYRLQQGRRRTIREVLVVGAANTNDRVVRREVGILPGDLVNMRKIERGRARIKGTGYFVNPRDPRHLDPQVKFREVEGDPELVDVEYRVQEGTVVDFQLGGGVNSDSGLAGRLSLNMRNFQGSNLPSGFWSSFGEIYRKEAFHGNGETFGIDLAPGSQVNYWRVAYAHPDLFGSHFNRFSGRIELNARDRIFRSHDEARTFGSVTLARLFGQGDFSVRFGPRWQRVDIDDLDNNVPFTLTQSEGETDFLGLFTEVRYSDLDNILSPRRGSFSAWSNTIYGGPFGGDNDLWKSELRHERYFQLGNAEDDVRPGIFLGGALGVAQPFDEPDFVNYAERFFLGGSAYLRGFDFRGVGPNDGDFALGGETMARFTAEYRYPIYSTPVPGTSRRQEMFRLTLFTDWGVLDPDSFQLDLDEVRASIGFGFGLVQPIPLTFQFGWPLREDDDDLEVFSFRLTFR